MMTIIFKINLNVNISRLNSRETATKLERKMTKLLFVVAESSTTACAKVLLVVVEAASVADVDILDLRI